MRHTVLIIGLGSIGTRHYNIIKKLKKIKKIYLLTKQKKFKNTISNIEDIIKIKPTHIIISNETNKHIGYVNFIEKYMNNCSVLIEKPIFSKKENFKPVKNKYFVGYNLRFNPIVNYIKKLILNEKILNINIFCGSYLPDWRKTDYSKSYSASKKLGGGVLLDLSHEIDYVIHLFGDMKLKYCYVNKSSSLKIDTEDNVILIGKTINGSAFNISLNYFTKIPHRYIIVDSDNITIKADLIKQELLYFKNSKTFSKKFTLERNSTYSRQLTSFFGNKKNLCTFTEANNIIKLITKLKTKKI